MVLLYDSFFAGIKTTEKGQLDKSCHNFTNASKQ